MARGFDSAERANREEAPVLLSGPRLTPKTGQVRFLGMNERRIIDGECPFYALYLVGMRRLVDAIVKIAIKLKIVIERTDTSIRPNRGLFTAVSGLQAGRPRGDTK